MPKQKVPDIEFGFFVLKEIRKLYDEGKIHINTEYQRGDIWTHQQRIELIKSIENRYSIGVLVLFVNDAGAFEILDGQQRLLTIRKYINDELDLQRTDIEKYSDLGVQDLALLDAYCVYFLKLKSHDAATKEEDIVQTFLRLQEGTPLNRAEKINAHRGEFKDAFRGVRETQPLFEYLGKEKRFRFRLLAAEMLLIELESNMDREYFPSLDLESFKKALEKYRNKVSQKKLRFLRGNLDFLVKSLGYRLTAFTPREVLSFYMLISYLRKRKAGNANLLDEFAVFTEDFLQNLYSFSMYDDKPPKGMERKVFDIYKRYKQEAKILTTADSIANRFTIIRDEYQRLHPFVVKDKKRLFDTEQKRILFWGQKGKCKECGKPLKFSQSSAHHGIAYSKGGSSHDLTHAQLLHTKCHEKLERQRRKNRPS